MSAQTNKEAVEQFIEEGWGNAKLSAFDDFFSEGIVHHALPPDMPTGIDSVKQYASMFLNAFPDADVSVADIVAEGDTVAYRWVSEATHTGELLGIPPTNKRVNTFGIAMDRFEGGKSVEHWEVFDQAGLMQQLGVSPD
ncbi:MAG: ester cyclase [Acidimicrobiia bacterium]